MSLGALDARLLDRRGVRGRLPGVSLAEPFFAEARRLGLEIVGDIELFARAAHAPVVGITGTNGKSTVTTLVGRMAARAGLKVQVGGNLGEPALDLLDAAHRSSTCSSCRATSWRPPHSLHCRAAAVLNVSPDHLDRYADVAAYAAAKARIFARCDIAVINLDDPLVVAMPHAAARTLSFSLRAAIGADYAIAPREGAWWLTRREEPLLPLAAMKIKGLHNAANALAALALGEALALPLAAMLEELQSFAGLAHRSQWVADVGGVTYVDDSKGTNVGATLAAVAGMDGPLVMILGGRGQEPGLRAARGGLPRQGALRGAHRPRRRRARAGARRGVPHRARDHAAGGGARPRRRRRSPATPCCSRPRAPASTCSATTRIAARCSRKRCGSWPRERRAAHSWDLRAPARATAPCTSMG